VSGQLSADIHRNAHGACVITLDPIPGSDIDGACPRVFNSPVSGPTARHVAIALKPLWILSHESEKTVSQQRWARPRLNAKGQA